MRRAFYLALILFLGPATVLIKPGKAMPGSSALTGPVKLAPAFNKLHQQAAGVINIFMGQAAVSTATAPVKRGNALRQKPEWYGSDEGVRIADNLLLYQRETGGWPKNIDMARVLTEGDKTALVKQKREVDSTIDNGSTYTQLAFLARVYTAKKLLRHQEAFFKGLDYLLKAQYDNGGWPQYYPVRPGYYAHITYNDDAMIGVMRLLRDIAEKRHAYLFVDADRRGKADQAVRKGIECILKTQVVVQGKRTVWCAQHDEVTLAPAPARKFEPVSLSGYESVGIVRFLMGIEHPNEQVKEAIESAVAWFDKSKINGIRWVEKPDAAKLHGFDRVVVTDTNAGPLWSRFYEIGTNRPIFIGRDSIIRYNVAEIEDERRNGYKWYVDEPAQLLNKDYPAWLKKHLRINGKLVEALTSTAKVKIVLVGDSTVTDKDGWGLGFKKHLSSEIECINLAKGGRSSKSYINEGWWQQALDLHGDYILIQFGHNDMPGKGPERETDPRTSYPQYIARYVDEARAAGAKPVLITSLTRRRFGKDGKIDSDLIPYADAVKKVAAEKHVPLIDLHALSIASINAMGRERSDELGKMKPDGKGGQEMDYTHLGDKGSEVMGKLVADELQKIEPELAALIK
jgi:PelA/Pel-15E family pectate lyase